MIIYYFSLFDWILTVAGILGGIYLYLTWNNNYFKKRNINFSKPVLFFGSFAKPMLKKTTFAETLQEIYNLFPQDKFTGFFEFRRPLVMIRDLELIKQITIKDYEYMLNHRFVIDEDVDALFGKNLFVRRGEKWRDMRVTLSPTFTGSKMRGMYSLTNECAENVVEFIKNEIKKTSVLELRELFTRFATDVIATTAFGVKTDSFTDKSNEFFEMGKRLTAPKTTQTMKFFGYGAFPSIMKYLRITLFDEATTNFFKMLVKTTIATRERDNIYRPDIIHLLMQARKGTLKSDAQIENNDGFAVVEEHLTVDHKNVMKTEITDDDITSQAMIFFFGGFDSVSTLICFVAYELTLNPDIQIKLQEEIDEAKEKSKVITYEVVQSLKYLDMVISETLRKWPPTPATDRCCVKPYTLYDGEKSIKLSPGDAVFIPIYALHHDPNYFPNPDKFDPERFNDENKHNIKPGSYIPFGSGPRNCIGSRFAIMKAKALIFHILANFDLKVSNKTQIPIQLSKTAFTLQAEDGYWVEFKSRV